MRSELYYFEGWQLTLGPLGFEMIMVPFICFSVTFLGWFAQFLWFDLCFFFFSFFFEIRKKQTPFTHNMTIIQQQTFNPPFSNPDDMPEYVSVYEMKPKRKSGRPKSSLTDEERAQKKKDAYKIWYHIMR